MKKFFVVLFALVLFATPTFSQTMPDDILDLALIEISTGNQWHFCTTPAPVSYAEATGAKSLANVTVTAATTFTPGVAGPATSGDYTLQSFDNTAPDIGRELLLNNPGAVTQTGTGTAAYICVVDSGGTDFLGCAPITNEVIGAGDTVTYDGNAKFQMRDIQ